MQFYMSNFFFKKNGQASCPPVMGYLGLGVTQARDES